MYTIEKSLNYFQESLKSYLELSEELSKGKGVCQETGRLCGLFDFGMNNAATLIQLKLNLLAQKKVLGLTDEEVLALAQSMGYLKEPIILHNIDTPFSLKGMDECLF